MPDTTSQNRLVLFSVPDDRDQGVSILKTVLGLHPTDANIQYENLPGILSRSHTEESALQAVNKFQAIGCKAMVVQESELPDLSHVTQLHHVRVEQNGLHLVGLAGEDSETLLWSALSLMSVGQVPVESHKHHLNDSVKGTHGAGLPHGPAATTGFQRGPELWLIYDSPFRAFRIEHQEMNYEYLGSRKTTSATQNFRLLVEDILQHASHLFLTHSTRAFIDHQSLEDYEFDTCDQHRDSVTLQILLMRSVHGN